MAVATTFSFGNLHTIHCRPRGGRVAASSCSVEFHLVAEIDKMAEIKKIRKNFETHSTSKEGMWVAWRIFPGVQRKLNRTETTQMFVLHWLLSKETRDMRTHPPTVGSPILQMTTTSVILFFANFEYFPTQFFFSFTPYEWSPIWIFWNVSAPMSRWILCVQCSY